jgi:hypothetical protein
MSLWLSIVLAVVCWLWAVNRIWYSLAYGTHFSIALRAAIGWVIFGILFLLVRWPQVLTYLSGTWAALTVVDIVLLFYDRGLFGASMKSTLPHARKAVIAEQAKKALGLLAIKGLLFGVFVYFIGF